MVRSGWPQTDLPILVEESILNSNIFPHIQRPSVLNRLDTVKPI